MKTKNIKVRKIDMYDRWRNARVAVHASAYYYPKLGVVWSTQRQGATPAFWEYQLKAPKRNRWEVPKTVEAIKEAIAFNTGYEAEVGPLITMAVPAMFADKSFRELQDDILDMQEQEEEFDAYEDDVYDDDDDY